MDSEEHDTILTNTVDSLNIVMINNAMTTLFKRYLKAIGNIGGSGLVGESQVRQAYKSVKDSLAIEYEKGSIVFSNGIDKVRYLLQHKTKVASAIGVAAEQIEKDKRNLSRVRGYIGLLESICELGDPDSHMQMYISRHDGNVGFLNSNSDWVDYILTDSWIDKLVRWSIGDTSVGRYDFRDYRIEYCSELLQRKMKDHEIQYHKDIDSFDESQFLDDPTKLTKKGNKRNLAETVGMINSIGRLDYGFYEIHKPIGGGNGRYVNVKMSTLGTVDISGVVSLSDCEHWKWEYGSMDYLRSKNTGNQRYLFKLSIPFNDLSDENPGGSVLWWKPDKPEPMERSGDNDGEQPKLRYYKPYEAERFMRWFGTTYIPLVDVDMIEKVTVCSVPELSDDVESDQFHSDATNIAANGMNLDRANVDEQTSLSLLSLSPKATVKVVNYMDEEHQGQYLEFVVSGHQNTTALSFHVRGKMVNVIQEMNHYANTWGIVYGTYVETCEKLLFLEASRIIQPYIDEIWGELGFKEDFLPETHKWARDELGRVLKNATIVDILRLRQLDMTPLIGKLYDELQERLSFMCLLDCKEQTDEDKERVRAYIEIKCRGDLAKQERIFQLVWKERNFMDKNLMDYIDKFEDGDADNLKELYRNIPLAEEAKEEFIRRPLKVLHGVGLPDDEQQESDEWKERYRISFEDVTVDQLRERIETFNNLVPRLPTDSSHNKLASSNIFNDWKRFVDGAAWQMVVLNVDEYENPETSQERREYLKDKMLYVVYSDEIDEQTGRKKWRRVDGLGSDMLTHKFTELYVDQARTVPLVDYSYLYKDGDPMKPYTSPETGKPIGDRWDYWSDDDFK